MEKPPISVPGTTAIAGVSAKANGTTAPGHKSKQPKKSVDSNATNAVGLSLFVVDPSDRPLAWLLAQSAAC